MSSDVFIKYTTTTTTTALPAWSRGNQKYKWQTDWGNLEKAITILHTHFCKHDSYCLNVGNPTCRQYSTLVGKSVTAFAAVQKHGKASLRWCCGLICQKEVSFYHFTVVVRA